MLPNLSLPDLKIFGPIGPRPFGVLAAIATVVGFHLGKRRASRVGLDPEICAEGMIWAAIVGFAMAHWVSAVFYFPHEVIADPLYLLKFWDGLSSFGGFVGGFLGAFVFFRRKRQPWLKYAEAILFGLVPAWAIGRLGCTVVFDHPGRTSGFFLAMADAQGIGRHNLGFYEMLVALVLTAVIYALKSRHVFDGLYISLVLLLYAPARFLLDNLRVADQTYLGLTPGQYFSVALFVIALVWLVHMFRRQGACLSG
jgi:phosphatidylglycerol:prolipoprotein diacylglycerol transferase